MEQIAVLVDYDNQRQGRYRGGRGTGRPPNYRDHADFIDDLINGILQHRKTFDDSLLEMRVRLYGGWTADLDGSRTSIGDMVVRAIREYGHSRRIKNTRIFLELAENPLALPRQNLFGTFRRSAWRGAALEYHGNPRYCAEGSTQCQYVKGILSWIHGRCPNGECRMRTEDAFLIQTQKLVDTLLVSDAIVSKERGYSHVLAVSMDDDIIPGLLSLAALGGKASVIRFGKQKPGYYDKILTRNGVSVIDYPALG